MKKRLVALTLTCALAATALAGCGGSTGGDSTASGDSTAATETSAAATETSTAEGSVYYLNFKPEQADDWVKLAETYTDETGVQVDVQTAASGTYESQLKSEMAKEEAPTLFQVNGPVGLASWKDYCYDLSDSQIYKDISSDDYVLKEGDEVKGIAYVVETYGIIYNKAILNQYFELSDAAVKSVDEINNFETLKKVADGIQKHKDELGVEGAFTSAGMDSSSDWRFKTHLANLPIYFEYQTDGISSTDAIKGTYLDNYRDIWNLYINNSTCDPSELSAKTGDDSRNEFLAGEAVFFQNGSWEYGNLTADGALTDDDLAMIPIYIGVGDEANQGLCTGTENYWCVNNQADEADIQATLDFMNWCVTSDLGTKTMAEDMGFVIPFKGAQESQNLFVKQDTEYTAAGKTPVSWNFTTMPSEEWKNGLGQALTAYAADETDANWDAVVSAFVDGWATEYQLANDSKITHHMIKRAGKRLARPFMLDGKRDFLIT